MNPLADTLMCPSSGHSIGPEANLREAACLLLQSGLSCLFSVDHNSRLVGKVTEDDLLQALFSGASDRTPAASLAVPVTTHVNLTDSSASARFATTSAPTLTTRHQPAGAASNTARAVRRDEHALTDWYRA